MQRKISECIFCNSTKLSKEHVWGDWLNCRFKSMDKSARTQHNNISIRADGIKSRRRGKLDNSGTPLSRRLKCACALCNNNWMSELERLFKPIFEKMQINQDISLERDDIKIIREWVFLKFLIQQRVWLLDRDSAGYSSFFDRGIRDIALEMFDRVCKEFRASRNIPSSYNIIICRMDCRNLGVGALTYNVGIAATEQGVQIRECCVGGLPKFGFLIYSKIDPRNGPLIDVIKNIELEQDKRFFCTLREDAISAQLNANMLVIDQYLFDMAVDQLKHLSGANLEYLRIG